MAEASNRPISVVIAALGGQGGGVLSTWVVETAEASGYLAQATSVPGVAQRTGATIYYIELFPEIESQASGREPVLALMPIPGDVDIVLASELAEAGRAVQRGFVTRERTAVIASAHRHFATSEKMAMGDGRADPGQISSIVDQCARQFIAFDMAQLAERTDSVISSVLLGALAGSGVLPFERDAYEGVIRNTGLAVEQNLAGFSAGFERAQAAGDGPSETEVAGTASEAARAQTRQGQELLERIDEDYPDSVRPMLVEGVKRLADYQDLRYARAYLNRLQPILVAEADATPDGFLLTTETARHLALWMSYEDTIRVADLKTRKERFARVRQELDAAPDQPVRIVEFMHPRIEEICDTLPAPLGRFVMKIGPLRRLGDRLFGHARQVSTSSISGFLLLYCVAGLKRWRRSSYRFKRESARIEEWLAHILAVAGQNHELALEIARCQRLIKGYGETHERGTRSFDAIMGALERIGADAGAAELVRGLHEAALADEHGNALQAALQELG